MALVVVALIAIGAYAFPRIQANLGAQPGPDLDSKCSTQNGMTICRERKALTTATTTPCAIKSPAATSTLAATYVAVTVASSTATTWTFAKATSAFATTTYLDSFSLSSGVQGTMYSSATTTGVDIKQSIAPNTWFVVGRAGTTEADTTLFKGFCSAQFNVI